MELGQYQIQVFLSLVVILGAAFVALICDLLKGNNEQLRELAIELKVRREEEQKRFQMLLPHVAGNAGAQALSLESPNPRARAAVVERAAAPEKPAPPVAHKRRAISADAVAVMEKAAQRAAAPRPRRSEAQPQTRSTPQFVVVRSSAASTTSSSGHKPAASRDWISLLNAQRKSSPKEPGLLDAVVAATASDATAQAAEPNLPSGFQDGFVLTRLVESRQPVSGLVVSIGASAPAESVPANVRTLIQSLIGPNDFAAQSGPGEFLLIFPGERGAAAQRRLTLIAQQLWDFQLRSLGSYSILFSWGGVEVRSESIDEAIASATERMEQTRRGRKMLNLAQAG